jgi:hypothetical protein
MYVNIHDMKTAVEWLIEHLNLDETSPNYNELIINKAKEMEKQQMFKALVKGSDVYQAYDIELEFNEYYNETFKSE